MPAHRIDLDHERKLVRVIPEGDIDQPGGETLISEARVLAAEHAYRILYDMRRATVRVDLSRYFFLPRELEVLKSQPTRSVRVAILADERQEREYRFYETVAANVGLTVGVFLDEAEALAWLEA